MASTRVLVKRRKAIRNIRKITRTMELIATARFKKAMDRATEADAFTRKIAELAADLTTSATEIKHPLLEKRAEIKNSVLLVLCSNRGLCGGYNGSILREAMPHLRKVQSEGVHVHLELSGKRAIAYFRFQGIQADQSYTHFEEKPTFEEVDVVGSRYLAQYIAGKIDRVDEGGDGERRRDDQGAVAEVQPGTAGADHEGDQRDHRRGGGAEIKSHAKTQRRSPRSFLWVFA
jgi:F-type H+-transporting ATPase subunit gamma